MDKAFGVCQSNVSTRPRVFVTKPGRASPARTRTCTCAHPSSATLQPCKPGQCRKQEPVDGWNAAHMAFCIERRLSPSARAHRHQSPNSSLVVSLVCIRVGSVPCQGRQAHTIPHCDRPGSTRLQSSSLAKSVLAKDPNVKAISKAKPRWFKGVFVGRLELDDSAVVLTDAGAVTVRTIRRLPADDQHDVSFLDAACGLPWAPAGKRAKVRAETSHVIAVPAPVAAPVMQWRHHGAKSAWVRLCNARSSSVGRSGCRKMTWLR